MPKKGFGHGRKKAFAKERSDYYFAPVDKANREKIYNRLLVNTYLNNPSHLEAMKMVIEGEAPVETLSSQKAMTEETKEKKPFAFIERTWEVRNPTKEEVDEALKAKEAIEEFEKEESIRRKAALAEKEKK